MLSLHLYRALVLILITTYVACSRSMSLIITPTTRKVYNRMFISVF